MRMYISARNPLLTGKKRSRYEVFSFRLRCQAQWMADRLRRTPFICNAVSAMILGSALLTTRASTRLTRLLTAARWALSDWLRTELKRRLRPHLETGIRIHPESTSSELPYTLILKAPGRYEEKGVLFSTVESAWRTLVGHPRVRSILDQYTFVGVSAWSPSNYKRFVEFAGRTSSPIFICVSNQSDLASYQMFSPLVIPLPMMASDWLDPREIRPQPKAERDIDLIMVAGWGRYKRHWMLFEALRKMPANLKIALVGADSENRTFSDVMREAQLLGVPQEISFHSNIPVQQVHQLLSRSRVKVLCSGREGACVAVAEALFADTPVALMENAHVGAKAHVNHKTGILLHRRSMASQLLSLWERSPELAPRKWALANISCLRSSDRLSEALEANARERGEPWTQGISPVSWRHFVPRHFHENDSKELAEAHIRFHSQFGLQLSAGLSD